MLIRSFGLFWGASEVNWNSGKGAKGEFRLLGRQGTINSLLIHLMERF